MESARRVYRASLAAAYVWSLANCAYVYRRAFGLMFWMLAHIGSGPAVFHVASWALHLAIAALAASMMLRFAGRHDLAAACFAVVLLNPLQLEASLWASGLQELLWAFF